MSRRSRVDYKALNRTSTADFLPNTRRTLSRGEDDGVYRASYLLDKRRRKRKVRIWILSILVAITYFLGWQWSKTFLRVWQQVQYLVKWLGYSARESSWVEAIDITEDLIRWGCICHCWVFVVIGQHSAAPHCKFANITHWKSSFFVAYVVQH